MKSTTTFVATDAQPNWQSYLATPFVHDTLAPLLNPLSVVVKAQAHAPIMRDDLRGVTSQHGDTVTMFGPPHDGYFTHELGHVVDVHNLAPTVAASVAVLFNPNNKQAGYAATNEREYVAEAFREAMQALRTAPDVRDKHIAKAEKRLPGTLLWVRWLQQQLAKPKTT